MDKEIFNGFYLKDLGNNSYIYTSVSDDGIVYIVTNKNGEGDDKTSTVGYAKRSAISVEELLDLRMTGYIKEEFRIEKKDFMRVFNKAIKTQKEYINKNI